MSLWLSDFPARPEDPSWQAGWRRYSTCRMLQNKPAKGARLTSVLLRGGQAKDRKKMLSILIHPNTLIFDALVYPDVSCRGRFILLLETRLSTTCQISKARSSRAIAGLTDSLYFGAPASRPPRYAPTKRARCDRREVASDCSTAGESLTGPAGSEEIRDIGHPDDLPTGACRFGHTLEEYLWDFVLTFLF